MELPQFIEKAGLNMDGIIWFRKTIDIPKSAAGKKATISLGPIDDSDETWVNSLRVGGTEKKYSDKRIYTIPAGTLKAGENSIAVKVVDTGGGGGIYGKPDEMFIEIGNQKIPIAGSWKYEVEKEYNLKNQNLFTDTSIGEVFMRTYLNESSQGDPVTVSSDGSTTVVRIKVIKNEMKYDRKTFEVEAGKPVEIVFENPDFMQHNLVITQPGTLENVGKAADKLASDPKGAEKQYVPDTPDVLFATKLVNPQQTVKLNFVAPQKTGDYPFVCTFPGHWSIMNGTMKVVKNKAAL
jgi:azurin